MPRENTSSLAAFLNRKRIARYLDLRPDRLKYLPYRLGYGAGGLLAH
jgi:hypothetical protein